MPESPHTSTFGEQFIEFLKSANMIFALLLVPLIKWIDSYFKWKSKRDSEFIKGVVKEGMAEEMRVINTKLDNIQSEVREVKKDQERDREKMQEEFLKIARDRR